MLCAGIDLQTGDGLVTDAVVGEHPLDSEADGLLGVGRHHVTVSLGLEPPDVAGVPLIELLIQLLAGQNCFGCVDDDDEFPAVNVRGVLGAVLAAENVRGGNGNAPERFISRVDHEPSTLDGVRVCHVSGHDVSSNIVWVSPV